MKIWLTTVLLSFASACNLVQSRAGEDKINQVRMDDQNSVDFKIATFGAGCFWCVEAVFQSLVGVDTVISGYMGGKIPNPTYREICTGKTGHAEVVQIKYDPSQVSYSKLLEIFWQTHDPTTLNRQGADVGTQYRSAIFYHDLEQQELAVLIKSKLEQAKAFDKPIVTEIVAASTFYPAEEYHQNYYRLNEQAPYCQFVIRPKMDKLERVFKDDLKESK